MDLADLTWTCHVCGDERPDRFISVHKAQNVSPSGISFQVNTRYCNDRAQCAAGAPAALSIGTKRTGSVSATETEAPEGPGVALRPAGRQREAPVHRDRRGVRRR